MANFQESSSRINFPSGTDFTSGGANAFNLYKIVKLSNGTVVASSAATDKHIGVLMNNPTASGSADVLAVNQQGTGKVTAGGTINANDYITSDSSGHAIATTTAGDIVIGQAVEAAANGQVFEYLSLRFKYA